MRIGGIINPLAAAGVAAFVLAMVPAHVCAQAPRQPAGQGDDVRKVFDFTRGLDPAQYIKVRGEDSGSLDVCRRDADARRQVKSGAFEDAFRQIDAMGRTYRRARPHYSEGLRRLTEQNDQSILREDLRFARAVEVYDHTRSQYRYVLEVWVRRLPDLVPQLDQELGRYLGAARPRVEKGEIVFDLTRIIGQLKNDKSFQSRLKALRGDKKFRSSIRYKDDDTQNFLDVASGVQVKIQGYERGQYSVNSLVGAIIERSVAVEIYKNLDAYRDLTVICEGGTDSLRISSPLAYEGNARVTSRGERLDPRSRQGRPLSSGIRNNIDLSFARGYEGLRALAQILDSALSSGRIRMFYTGKGIVATQGGDRPDSRQIIFRIVLGPKLP